MSNLDCQVARSMKELNLTRCFNFLVDAIIFVEEKMPCTEIMFPDNLAIDVFDCDGGTVLHCRESKGCFRIQHCAGDASP